LLLELHGLLFLFIILTVSFLLIPKTLLFKVAEESLVLEQRVVRIDLLLALGFSRGELFGGIPPEGLVRENARVKRYSGSCTVGLARTAHFVWSIAQHDALVVAN